MNRLFHGDVIPSRTATEKAHRTAIDRFARVERGRAVHMTPEAKLGVFVGAHNAGFRLAQRGKHHQVPAAQRLQRGNQRLVILVAQADEIE